MSLKLLLPYFVENPKPIIGAETIQVLLLREIHDYTVLRTEETRELNTVITPLSLQGDKQVRRVAFLGSKQKAAESRMLERLLRTAVQEAGMSNIKECYLKDNLCLSCPRCTIYGATNTQSGKGQEPNIKHRIEYSTAFSLQPVENIEEAITFNAINDKTQTTGQALGTRFAVKPASVFPSIVTFRGVTREEFILGMKTIMASKSYGAEARIGGDVRNMIVGIVAGWEEIITSLEFTLECYDVQNALAGETVEAILEKYKPLAANISKVQILPHQAVESLLAEIGSVDLDKQFLETCYKQVEAYKKSTDKK